MSASGSISTADEAAALQPGQWVWSADDRAYCLVDTNILWPQRMWMTHDGMSHVHLDGIAYPLSLTELDGDCDHAKGLNECGHCRRCGALVGEPRDVEFVAVAEVSLPEGGVAS